MDAAEFLLARHEPLHGAMTAALFEGLAEAQVRARPHGLNSIAWLLWHVARAEDIGVNRFGVDGREVLDDAGWGPRIGLARRDLGTGMTEDEVDALSHAVDVAALRGYWDAVGHRTVEVIRTTGSTGWEQIVGPERIRRIVHDEGGYGPNAEWTAPFYAGQTRGWMIGHLALTHSYGHFFDARTVRGALGFPGR
jgi:hypothetical protein